MKKTILILAALALIAGSCNQATKQKTTSELPTVTKPQSSAKTPIAVQAQQINPLEDMIIKTIKAYQNKDEKTLNQLVLKDFGIAFVHRPGVMDDFIFSDKISFNKPIPDYDPYDVDVKTDGKVRFEDLPVFDCDKEKWNKPHGIYCDTTINIDILSDIAKFRNENLEGNYSAAEIKKFENIEKRSYKVIVLGKKGNSFRFFLTFKNNKWYLTIIDRIDYCSA